MQKKVTIGLGVSCALALAVGAAVPALADVQANPKDVVGVGSDTVQYVGDFLDNGYNATGTAMNGYNTVAKIYKVFNFDATADAAGTAQYSFGQASRSTGPYPSAVVLRAGGFPYFRPQGSGDGIKSFLNDKTAPYKVNFVRSSRLPSAAEQNTAADGTHNFGGLHVIKIATDGLDLAYNNKTLSPDPGYTTCVPSSGFTVNELVNIYNGTYTTFGAVPGYSGPAACASDPIAPMAPDPSKSGTGKDFKGDLDTANGSTVTYSTNRVVFVEEHDPKPLTASGQLPDGTAYAPQDAVAPFSTGRYNLIQLGYFDHVQDFNTGSNTVLANTIGLRTGGTTYHKNRTLYIILRENDYNSTTAWFPNTTASWATVLFKGTTSQYGKSTNAGLFTAAGVTQAYQDLGVVNS